MVRFWRPIIVPQILFLLKNHCFMETDNTGNTRCICGLRTRDKIQLRYEMITTGHSTFNIGNSGFQNTLIGYIMLKLVSVGHKRFILILLLNF